MSTTSRIPRPVVARLRILLFAGLLGLALPAQKPLATISDDNFGNRTLVIYDVHGILRQPAPILEDVTGGQEDGLLEDVTDGSANSTDEPAGFTDVTPKRRRTAPRRPDGELTPLCALARSFIEPPLQRGEEIRGIAGRCVAVYGRTEQQEWFSKFLNRHRQDADAQIQIEMQLAFVDPVGDWAVTVAGGSGEMDQEFVVPFRPNAEPVVLEPWLVEALQSGLEARAHFTLLNAPRLLSYALTDVSLESISQTSIIRRFDEVPFGSGEERTTVANPIVEVIDDGIRLAGRSCILPGNGEIGIDFRLDYSDLQHPIPTQVQKLSNGIEVTVQVPDLRKFDLEARAVLVAGQTLQLTGPLIDERLPVLWLTAKRIDD